MTKWCTPLRQCDRAAEAASRGRRATDGGRIADWDAARTGHCVGLGSSASFGTRYVHWQK